MSETPPLRPARREFIASLAGAAWALAAGDANAAVAPAIGSKLPLVDLPLIEGGTFRAAQARGKVVVVYWWASWCPFCAEMSPGIEKLWREQQGRGLTVLGISIDKTLEAPRDYRRRKGYTFPSAMLGPQVAAALPKNHKIPVVWVRGRTGNVEMAETGQLFPEDIEQIARFL